MRISTSMMYRSVSSNLSKLESDLFKTQQQVSSESRVLTPSDDPVAAARILEIKQTQSVNAQYAENRTMAKSALTLEDQTLSQLTTLVQNTQTLIVKAGNASFDDTQRGDLAVELRGYLEEMLSLSNTQDTFGNYIFSGYKNSTEAFIQTTTGADFKGDQGERSMQVDFARKMKVSDSGDTVFENGDAVGTLSVTSTTGNFSVGDVTELNVTDEASITGNKYEVVFSVTGSTTTYSVFDVTTDPTKAGTPTATGTYADPMTIGFGGVELNVKGTRADGDIVALTTEQASKNKNMFESLTDLINLLETKTLSPAGKANLNQGLATLNNDFASALDNVLSVTASVGASLSELEKLDTAGIDRDIQYSQMIVDLDGYDAFQAATQLAQQKLTLQAAQQSYVQITGLSLFNYL